MFKFIANFFAAQRNAAALVLAYGELKELEAKFRNVVSHATAGHTADITAPLNDIAVEISRVRNGVWKHAQESKARELAGDLLHSMHEAERKVLVTFHDEVGRPLADVADYTGLSLNDVRTLAKGLVIKGLAHFGPLVNDDGHPAGSGYLLTVDGAILKDRQLAANVIASANAAAKLKAA